MAEIFSKEELEKGLADGTIQPNLPPPGDARNEELAKRADQLAEQAEQQYSNIDSIPEHLLEPDREIQDDIHKGFLNIGLGHKFLKTKWVNWKSLEGKRVYDAKAEGWTVSKVSDFPEGRDLQAPDGSIRVADVLLMHMRIDRYLMLEQKRMEKNLRIQQADQGLAEAKDIARRYPQAVKVKEELSTTAQKRANAITNTARSMAAIKTAKQHLGEQMKKGPIPGVPIK